MQREKNKEKVLITGAAGFIGSHLTEALIKKGYKVIGLLAPTDETRWIKNLDATFIYADITDKDLLYKKIPDVSYIYHLAAILSGHCPEKIYRVNYEGTKNLVNVCLELGIKLKRFLFISSAATMGPTGKTEIFDEDAPCNPVSDYGKSKLLAEQFLNSVKDRLPFTTVRLPLVYGPRAHGGLFAIFMLLNKGIRINIGKGKTNVGFVKDIVDGMILASESPVTIGKTYHLGEDKIYTSNEIWSIIEKAVGKKSIKLITPYSLLYLTAFLSELYAKIVGTKIVFRRQAINEYIKYRYWQVDMNKAEREFGFKAKTPLEIGAKITVDWYKKESFI
jgi:nucleoside-diphosphate-sugar epimerase